MTSSGKMIALADLLHQLRATTEEKIVLVSNFTQARPFAPFPLSLD